LATPSIAILDQGYRSYDIERRVFEEAGCRLSVFAGERHDRKGKFSFAQGAAGIMIRWTDLDGEALDRMPSVRYAVRYGVGYDNVDLAAATARGVLVSNVQGYATHSVSDHALALLLACLRELRAGARGFREHYGAPPREEMPELRQLTVGIIGLGRIGSAFCTKVRPLVRRVLAHDPYVATEHFQAVGAEPVGLEDLLRESDAISLHCALTTETRGMVGTVALEQVKPGALLINTARGPVMEEQALLSALLAGRVRGAGLDVFHDEPPLGNLDGLLAHPRVIATGHYAWHSIPAGEELQRRAAENMAAMLRGETPADCLNPGAATQAG